MQAMIEGDIETINKIYSDDYELVTRNGILRSRAERIEMLESGKLRYVALGEQSNVSIKTYGNIAIVRGITSAAVTEYEGVKRISVKRRFIEIWEYDNEEWREMCRQTTAIIDSAP
ncbi:nuclear transport factor 2 family protein [Gemmatimonadota bacterium]